RHKMIPSIHTKGAEKTVLGLLKKYNIQKSIIHWYSGPLDLIAEFLEQGCYFTIGPDILSGSEIYLHLPMERILVETDNPTGMTWISGHKNRGDDIIKVYKQLSKKIPIEKKLLIELVKENLIELMNKNL
ncbi:MAG: TatD family hydrolase, partial [Spirochaetaceae bacterium]|nr:TatD family hydrolase [Spirochaetaceae bacterium]